MEKQKSFKTRIYGIYTPKLLKKTDEFIEMEYCDTYNFIEFLEICNNNTFDKVTNKIIQLIKTPDLMKKISGNNVLEVKEKYDIKKISKTIIDIYDNILIRKIH